MCHKLQNTNQNMQTISQFARIVFVKKKNLTATSVTRNNAKAVHTYGTQLMILLNETDQLLEQ